MLDAIKPGQMIKCTVTKAPKREDLKQTISRLMRNDDDVKRRLKGAQEHRMKTLIVRSRGKRPWAVRQKSARYALPVEGATWTMKYYPQVAGDFRAVEPFVKVESA